MRSEGTKLPLKDTHSNVQKLSLSDTNINAINYRRCATIIIISRNGVASYIRLPREMPSICYASSERRGLKYEDLTTLSLAWRRMAVVTSISPFSLPRNSFQSWSHHLELYCPYSSLHLVLLKRVLMINVFSGQTKSFSTSCRNRGPSVDELSCSSCLAHFAKSSIGFVHHILMVLSSLCAVLTMQMKNM